MQNIEEIHCLWKATAKASERNLNISFKLTLILILKFQLTIIPPTYISLFDWTDKQEWV